MVVVDLLRAVILTLTHRTSPLHLVREGNAKLTKKVKHIGFNPLTAMPKFCCVFVEQFKLITKTFSRGK
uniref:Uncharacterized protein n=1 Tax=Glossina palpalis gambiensis TaxID=67801 RepID=A0A1B0B248_9MUSC